jgi:hypothetical protein
MITALSDTELILIIVGVFYLSECIFWLPETAVTLTSAFGKLRLATSPVFLRRTNSQAAILSLFPWSRSLVAEDWPVAVSPSGISILFGPHAGHFIAFEDLQSVEAEKHSLRLNQCSIRYATSSAALQIATLLQTLKTSTVDERASLIRSAMQSRFSLSDFSARLENVERFTDSLRTISLFMFLWVFGYGPLLYYTVELRPGLLFRYFAPLGILWLSGVVLFAIAQRKLLTNSSSEQTGRVATLCFSPAAVMRAAHAITHEAFSGFDPSAVAVSILHPKQLSETLSQRLRNLLYPPSSDDPNESHSFNTSCEWYNELQLTTLQEMLTSADIAVDELLNPPIADYGALSWCPRCLAQYTFSSGVCFDCRGVSLQSFETDESDPAPA